MSNLIQMLGLGGQIISISGVTRSKLMTDLLDHIESSGGYVSSGVRQVIRDSYKSYAVLFRISQDNDQRALLESSYNRTMTYTEFRKKYKNLPQFLEQWKKHKEANG